MTYLPVSILLACLYHNSKESSSYIPASLQISIRDLDPGAKPKRGATIERPG